MDGILEMRDEMVAALAKADDLFKKADKENRILTPEEETAANEYAAEADRLKDRIERVERQNEAKKRNDERRDALKQVGARKTTPTDPQDDALSNAGPRLEIPLSHKKLKAFSGPEARENAYKCGRWLKATLLGDSNSQQFCLDHGMIDGRYNVQKGGDNATGGFLVPSPMSQAIIDLREDYGVFRRNAKIQPMSSDTLTISRRAGGLTAEFAGESSTASESDKTWNQIQLVAKKLSARARMTTEIAEDAIINMADDLADEIAYAFSLKEDQTGFNGDGSSTYGGITGVTTALEAETGYAGYINATSGDDTFEELLLSDFVRCVAALPEYAENRNPKWYISKYGWGNSMLRLSTALAGNRISDVEGGGSREFLGYPVEISQVLPGSGSQDNKAMVLFGVLDLAATLGSRTDVRVSVTDQRYWDTDEIGVKGTERFDVNVHDIGDASDAGPVVGLIGNAS